MFLRLSIKNCTSYKTISRLFGHFSKCQAGSIGSVHTNGEKGEETIEKSSKNGNNDRIFVDSRKYSRISSDDDVNLRQSMEFSNMSAARQVERDKQEQRLSGSEDPEKKKIIFIGENSHLINKDMIFLGSPRKDGIAENTTTHRSTNGALSVGCDLSLKGTTSSRYAIYIIALNEAFKKTRIPYLDGILKLVQQTLLEQKFHIISWATARRNRVQYLLQNAGKSLNEVTGYSEIEKLKLLVVNAENEIKQARDAVKVYKLQYERAIQNRSDSQKEINELLTRKHNWTPQDVERFTELYKNDHKNMNNEAICKQRLDDMEQNVEAVQLRLTKSILTRYHEEQIWSDKIRQASTWGTWMLMGVNIVLFATATFFVEPWKRRKLVYAFQTEVHDKLGECSTQLQAHPERLSPIKRSSLQVNETSSGPEINHRLCFSRVDSWNNIKEWGIAFLTAVKMPGNTTFTMRKPDFAVYSGILVAVGWLLGSFINAVVF